MVTSVADGQLSKWLGLFNDALLKADAEALTALFHPDAFWRDLLAFTWNIHTAEGRDAICAMLTASLARTASGPWLQTGPARPSEEIVEGVATFKTSSAARCHAVVRLKQGKASTLLTSMAELKQMATAPDPRRSSPLSSAKVHALARCGRGDDACASAQDPYCVVVGAGHCGLALGARLQQLGVPTLLIDRHERPSDTWRRRHDGLGLHSPSYFDRMPGFAYPERWPLYPSKDRFADWLDAYRSVMDLKVWTGTECVAANFDEERNRWRLEVRRGGRTLELHPVHLVVATGLFGAPNIPDVPGRARFSGIQQFASWYRRGPDHAGRRCVVVGSGTTAHDVAADLCAAGAEVTMIQRSATIVMRLESLIEGFAQLYGDTAKAQGVTTELADLLFTATPIRVLVRMHQGIITRLKQQDAAYYRRLADAGFQLTFGEDEGGIFPQILRDPGGYYVDVGASELIVKGRIKLRSGVGLAELTENSVILSDGSELPADAIFYATGYMRSSMAPFLEPQMQRKVGRVWGLGSGLRNDPGPWEGELRNMWKPTPQAGLWFHGGGIGISRPYSQLLALQIKARHAGLPTPVYGGAKPSATMTRSLRHELANVASR